MIYTKHKFLSILNPVKGIYISENLCFYPIKGKAGDFRKDSCEGGQMNREAKQLPVNPKYKDAFFRMLFREKEELMKQYMQYVERVRNYARAQGMSLDEAVSMCIFEYDEEKEMEKYKRAESLYIREELEKELREELTEEIQLEVLKNLIQQGCITVEDAAKQMETTVEEFRRMIDCQNSGSVAAPAEH